MRDMETESVQCGPLDFLCSIRKEKKMLQRVTGKFRGRRDGSLRCFRSDQRSLFPIIRRHLSSSPTMNPKADDRSIDSRARSIRRLHYAENFGRARQQLITISVKARSISPLKSHPVSRITLFKCCFFLLFFSFFLLLFASLPLFDVVVVVLFYFRSYSRAQFCVLLPPVTLAENNNNICSRPLDKGRDYDSPRVALSLCLFEF